MKTYLLKIRMNVICHKSETRQNIFDSGKTGHFFNSLSLHTYMLSSSHPLVYRYHFDAAL